MKSATLRRLLPLYCACFLQSTIFWYAVEKLFMEQQIGFDEVSIGLMAAIYSGVMLVAETPSGILADRWSRRGVLLLGSVALALSCLICGLSHSVLTFIVGSMFWGVYYALYSGTYDAIVYDTLQEEQGNSELYEKYYGYIQIVESGALVFASLVGGLLGQWFGLRAPFLWSIPFGLLAIIPLLLFKEPRIHKAEVETPISHHVRGTFAAVVRRGLLLQILCAVTGLALAIAMIFEFAQLWYVAIVMPVGLYGAAYAIMLACPGLAGWAVRLFQRPAARIGLAVAGAIVAFGLFFGRNTVWVVLTQALLSIALTTMSIGMNKQLHDRLPSRVRAGAASAVSTLSRLLFIPLSLLFGYLGRRYSIFIAGWTIIAVVVIACFFTAKVSHAVGAVESAK
jgi:MFS family permease